MQGNYKSGLRANSPTNAYSRANHSTKLTRCAVSSSFLGLITKRQTMHPSSTINVHLSSSLTHPLTPTSLTTRCSLGLTAIGQIFTVINEQSQASFDENFNWISYYNWTGGNGALSPAVNNAVRCGLITKLRSAYLIIVRRVTASRKATVD